MNLSYRQEFVTILVKDSSIEDLTEISVKLTTTFPNWESMGFNLTSGMTPDGMVHLFGLEHGDRSAGIKTLLNQNGEHDKEGSIEVSTPIEGYEYFSLLFTIGQNSPYWSEQLGKVPTSSYKYHLELNGPGKWNEPTPYFITDFSGFEDTPSDYEKKSPLVGLDMQSYTKFVVEYPETLTEKSKIYLTVNQLSSTKGPQFSKEFHMGNPWLEEIHAQVHLNNQDEIVADADMGNDYHISLAVRDAFHKFDANVDFPDLKMETTTKLSNPDSTSKMAPKINMGQVKLTFNDISIEAFIDHRFTPKLREMYEDETSAKMGIKLKNIGLDIISFSLSHSNEHDIQVKEFEHSTKSRLDLQIDDQEFLWRVENGYSDQSNWKHHSYIKTPFENFESLILIFSSYSEIDFLKLEGLVKLEKLSMSQDLQIYIDHENNGEKVLSYESKFSSSDSDEVSNKKVNAELRQRDDEIGEHFTLTFSEDGRKIFAINMIYTYPTTEAGPGLKMTLASPFTEPMHLTVQLDDYNNENFSGLVELQHDNNFHIHLQNKMIWTEDGARIEAKLRTSVEDQVAVENEFLLELHPTDEGGRINSELVWNGKASTFTAFQNQNEEATILGLSIVSPEYINISGAANFTDDRIDMQLKKEDDAIELVAEKKIENGIFLVMADFSSPIEDWETVKIEASLDFNPKEVISKFDKSNSVFLQRLQFVKNLTILRSLFLKSSRTLLIDHYYENLCNIPINCGLTFKDELISYLCLLKPTIFPDKFGQIFAVSIENVK